MTGKRGIGQEKTEVLMSMRPLMSIILLIAVILGGMALLPGKVMASGSIATCADCHGNPPVDSGTRDATLGRFPGSHGTHTGSAAGQYGMSCEICHVAPLYTALGHQGDSIQVNLRWLSMAGGVMQPGSAPGWGSYSRGTSFALSNSPTFGTCANTYCHSTATGGTLNAGETRAIAANTSALWGTVTPGCSPCHGGEPSNLGSGAPWYTNTLPKANTHREHAPLASGAGVCSRCHFTTTNTGNTITSVGQHIKRTYTVAPNTGGGINFTYNFTTSGGTCSNTTCHTSNTSSGQVRKWGSNNFAMSACVKCHGISGQTTAQFNTDNNVASPGYNASGTNTWNTLGTITNNVSNAPKVWAHDSHLRSSALKGYTTIRGVECDDCHAMAAIKADVYSASHMNGSTTFTWSSLVRNVGNNNPKWGTLALTPWYSSGNQACGNIYCHGSSAVSWTTGVGGLGLATLQFSNNAWLTTASAKNATSCNQCHLSPPTRTPATGGGYDHAGMPLSDDCSGCHGHNGAGTSHMDGTLYGAGSCNSCHWYDTVDNGAWATNTKGNAGNLWNSTNAWGAHVKHINHIKTRYSQWLTASTDTYTSAKVKFVCGFCHSQQDSDHRTANTRSITWNTNLHQFGSGAMLWNSNNGRTCSNLDCHYKETPVW